MSDNINYQPVSPDPNKSCFNCKHYQANEGDDNNGDCFGYTVSSKGICNMFEAKNTDENQKN